MFIAVDIGTTNVKAVVFDERGELLFSAEAANQTLAPQEGWSEQVPEQVFENVCTAVRTAAAFLSQNRAPSPIQGIAFSAAMHGLLALDAQGRPLGNFMLWSDVRAQAEARELLQNGMGQRLYQKTGVPIHPMSPLLKLIWLRKNTPTVFQQAHKFLGIKEYVWYRLTGQFESDFSCASATGLMDLLGMHWDEEALSLAGITSNQLPALVSPYKKTPFLDNSGDKSMGLPLESIPLIIGASDGALANLGSGATQPGQLALTIGTSAAVRMMTITPILDAQMRTFCYRLDETRFIVGGASNNGSNALEWLRTRVFRSPLDPEAFANQAIEVPLGAEGLQFLPYLHGERAPLWDASAKASFIGLTAQHGQAHFVRAAMEGVLFNLKSIVDVLEEKIPVQSIHISGGFTRNSLWVSMLAEIFKNDIAVDSHGADASARGAFMLGRVALQLR